MKKQISYVIILISLMLEACQFKSTPKVGDVVSYEYIVKESDSIVFKSARQFGDTASIILEDINNIDPTKRAIVERIMKMSENDSLSFDVNNNQKGFLRLYKITHATDFPKLIEEGNKRQLIFNNRLQEIKKELIVMQPFYQNRQKMVIDSAKMLFEQSKAGQLNGKLNEIGSDNTFYVVKGNSEILPEKRKWVWFHYVALLPDNTLMDSYNNMPNCTNLAEFSLSEALERCAGSFQEGSIILLTPKNSAVSNQPLYWMEVVKVLNL